MPSTEPADAKHGNLPAALTRRQRQERTQRALVTAARSASPARRQALLDYVVRLNLCIARDVAIRHLQHGRDNDRIMQVAHDALAHAVRDYEPDQDEDFLVYVVSAIQREIAESDSHAEAVPGAAGWTPGT